MEAVDASNYFHISYFLALVILSTYCVFCKCLKKMFIQSWRPSPLKYSVAQETVVLLNTCIHAPMHIYIHLDNLTICYTFQLGQNLHKLEIYFAILVK